MREQFKESSRRMGEGVDTGSAVEKAARDVVARFTSEGRAAVQSALERARSAAVEHVDHAATEQKRVLDSEAQPFATDQQESARSSREDARVVERAGGAAAVAGAKTGLAEAAKAATDDAQFRETLARDQTEENRKAEATAAEKKRAVAATTAKLR